MSANSQNDSNEARDPPKTLYKYLSPARVADVLETGTAKFTPLANTNDMFEIRKTFERLAGPRFHELFDRIKADTIANFNFEEKFNEKLTEALGRKPTRNERRLAKSEFKKKGVIDYFNNEMNNYSSIFESFMATNEASELFYSEMGEKLLCFSLSESYNIPPMWAHYAEGRTGFVIGFDTESEWFKPRSGKAKTRLHKVHYSDGIIDEFLADAEAAFGSKTSHWSYEQEWRLYCGKEDIDSIIKSTPDDIFLMSFPENAISSIIIGDLASSNTIHKIKTISSSKYRNAKILKATPNPRTSSLDLVAIENNL